MTSLPSIATRGVPSQIIRQLIIHTASTSVEFKYSDSQVEERILADRHRTFTRHLGHRLGIGPKHSVLELGCAAGSGLQVLCKDFNCVAMGVDQNAALVDAANVTAQAYIADRDQASVRCAHLTHLPSLDRCFDFVIHSGASWLFWPRLDTICREMYRVLLPNGRFAACLDHGIYRHLFATEPVIAQSANDILDYLVALENAGFRDVALEYETVKDGRFDHPVQLVTARRALTAEEPDRDPELEEENLRKLIERDLRQAEVMHEIRRRGLVGDTLPELEEGDSERRKKKQKPLLLRKGDEET